MRKPAGEVAVRAGQDAQRVIGASDRVLEQGSLFLECGRDDRSLERILVRQVRPGCREAVDLSDQS